MGTQGSHEDPALSPWPLLARCLTVGSHSLLQLCLNEFIAGCIPFLYAGSGVAGPSRDREWQINEVVEQTDGSLEIHLASTRVLPVCPGWRKAESRQQE